MGIHVNIGGTHNCNRTLVTEVKPRAVSEVVFVGFIPDQLYTVQLDSKIADIKTWFGANLTKQIDCFTIQVNTKDYRDSNILQVSLFTTSPNSELVIKLVNTNCNTNCNANC